MPISVTNIGVHAFIECANLTIHAEATSQPFGWNRDWNRIGTWTTARVPVEWGATRP
jgi:hypothetical protein